MDYKVVITETIEAIVSATSEEDALRYVRSMNPTITTKYEVEPILKGEKCEDEKT